MKILKKLLLIHWHYFSHELIEFGELNFLTGKNSSGKSTIIDAMQLVLLGDTSGTYFNKAASSRGNRTLKGYLLGELGDDDESGFRSLRGGSRFTSYIAMEFFDSDKEKYFTAGCCFDVFSENDVPRMFFIYDGEMHPQEFIASGTPMDISALRVFLRENYSGHHETTNVGKEFRTKFYGRLGGLRERFASLLKKAVAFDPSIDLQQFISDFVCDDQQTVDVSHMQENIRSYKRLEEEASLLQERIELLGSIVKTYDNYADAAQSEVLYSYLIDRATANIKTLDLIKREAEAEEYGSALESLAGKLQETDKRLNEYRDQRGTLQAELLVDENTQTAAQIEQQIADKTEKSKQLQDEYDLASGILGTRVGIWRTSLDAAAQKISITEHDLLQAGLSSRINDISEECSALIGRISELGSINDEDIKRVGEEGFTDISQSIDMLRIHVIELNSRLKDEQAVFSKRRESLLIEEESLESGRFKFPQDAIDLRDAVNSRLRTLAKKDIYVRIIAEVAEVTSDRWRNAVEGYLHNQKFYIIVPDDYFKDALRVFNAMKREKNVYGTGIVDIEKLRRLNPAADKGSLAEEIETDDPEVRLFLDYTLGRLQKCDNVNELRRHRTSITDEGMLYQNFVVRAINHERWRYPAIGQGAILRRLEEVKSELNLLTKQTAVCAGIINGIELAAKNKTLDSSEIERSVASAFGLAAIPSLYEDIVSLKENLAVLDMSMRDNLKTRIAQLDATIGTMSSERDGIRSDADVTAERRRLLIEETIPLLREDIETLEAAIAVKFDPIWISATGELRYSREMSQRGNPESIANAFPRELSRAKNAKEENWNSVVDLRHSYNDKYKMGYDYRAAENDIYTDALSELSNNKLPEYHLRISDAKEKALEQFQEDFISRIHNNIKNANLQIDELNNAIKGASFGEDDYRFKIIPKPEYKRYHDMIMDEMITQGGYTLFSLQFNDKYKEEITELFAIITNEGGSGGSSEYERRVREFTDFKTYLNFELEVYGHDGIAQRLSKTIHKKSGGETQTPFYVSVLASFAQLYRSGRDKAYKTSRLIIFDEAFSKMDSERIIKSVELLRKFKFQAILSAPPDKIDDIAGLVDRNICVHRDGKRISIGSFDPPLRVEVRDET